MTAAKYPSGRTQRAFTEEERRERKQDDHGADQPSQPISERERWHGKPRITHAHGEDRGVVDGKEAGERFVGNVQRQGRAQSQPGGAEAGITG